jgi:2-iminoacetate synthase
LYHAAHLEAVFGVGPHTVSIPRIRPAAGAGVFTPVSDEHFKKIAAVLRLALPYTGLIISTRENAELRTELLNLGVSQLSGGSRTGVGGYAHGNETISAQFEVSDTRPLDEIVQWLCRNGFIPSFCTACYRENRVGDRFMALAKSGQIGEICQPNALVTLQEYLCDYAGTETRSAGEVLIKQELESIKKTGLRAKTELLLSGIVNGKRDLRI